jgi:hypothetical protein
MQVKVQNSTSTGLPRRDDAVSGSELSHPSVGDQQRQAVEHQVERRRSSGPPREAPYAAGDLDEDVSCDKLTSCSRGAPRDQVGLACELQVKGHELPGGPQHERGSIAAETRREGDVAAHKVCSGALKLGEPPGLRRGH